MARKSRKQNNQESCAPRFSSIIQTAAYIRLSVDDRLKKGNSIENQQLIISDYINNNPNFVLYDAYIDEGVSGTTFVRPNFQRMLHDAQAGKISCIIVKDLSRLGRDMISTGYYIENVFPRLDIRLISIGDDYDSDTYTGDIRLPLKNLMNEAFALDISRKTKSQVRQAMKDGIYVGGKPPYGYKKSSDRSSRLIIDNVTAKVVKQIFLWKADGMSISEITRKLNSMKIPPPGRHKLNKVENNTISGVWHISTVSNILSNEIYQGHLIQGKTKSVWFKRYAAPFDEWVFTLDAHEAIITSELFQSAQSAKQQQYVEADHKKTVSYTPNIYKGKIYCAHCGNRLERKKNHNTYIFRCITNRTMPDSCSGNYIHEEAINTALSKELFLLKEDISAAHSNIEQVLRNETSTGKYLKESLQVLDDFAQSLAITRKIVERFVDKLAIFQDGRVHVIWDRSRLNI